MAQHVDTRTDALEARIARCEVVIGKLLVIVNATITRDPNTTLDVINQIHRAMDEAITWKTQ